MLSKHMGKPFLPGSYCSETQAPLLFSMAAGTPIQHEVCQQNLGHAVHSKNWPVGRSSTAISTPWKEKSTLLGNGKASRFWGASRPEASIFAPCFCCLAKGDSPFAKVSSKDWGPSALDLLWTYGSVHPDTQLGSCGPSVF